MNDDCLKQAVYPLLAVEGLVGDIKLSLLKGGRNNRVYSAECGQVKRIVKSYFQHSEDPRNRCKTEFTFSTFCWEQGIRCIPKPLQIDAEPGLAIYEFVEGSNFAENVTLAHVDEALQFFAEMNRCRLGEKAMVLEPVSEACFSIMAHLQRVDGRVQALVSDVVDSECRTFVEEKLVPVWKEVRSSVESESAQLSLELETEIPIEHRIISPSDFGFHNAIVRPSGKLCFIDFEYAGWDDIAKTANDFFIQPTHPVPEKYWQHFLEFVLEDFEDKQMEAQRIEILKPVQIVKWVCILLNEFLRVSSIRRNFALGNDLRTRIETDADEETQRKVRQLNLAEKTLERVQLCLASR